MANELQVTFSLRAEKGNSGVISVAPLNEFFDVSGDKMGGFVQQVTDNSVAPVTELSYLAGVQPGHIFMRNIETTKIVQWGHKDGVALADFYPIGQLSPDEWCYFNKITAQTLGAWHTDSGTGGYAFLNGVMTTP